MPVVVSITQVEVEVVPILGLGGVGGALPKVGQFLVVTFAMHGCVYIFHRCLQGTYSSCIAGVHTHPPFTFARYVYTYIHTCTGILSPLQLQHRNDTSLDMSLLTLIIDSPRLHEEVADINL